MAKVTVGLAIRTQHVEVVEARRTLTGVAMTKYVRVPIAGPEDAHVVSAIQTCFTTAQISPQRVGVTIPPQDVLLRAFVLPHLPRSEWPTSVQFEARKYIPFKIEELIWDFYALEQRETKQLDVIFAGIRTEMFARVQNWLQEAGVQPAWIEAPWLSMARLAPRVKGASPNDCLAVLDVEPPQPPGTSAGASRPPRQEQEAGRGGGQVAHLVIVKNQLPYLARDIMLAHPAGRTETGESNLDARVEKLVSELRLSFGFFTREHQAALINRLVLFGDAATLEPWCGALSAQLHCPVDLGTLPLQVRRRESTDLGFALAASVASRELRLSPARLNLAERLPSQGGPASRKGLETAALLSWLNVDGLRSMAKPALVQAVVAGVLLLALYLVMSRQVASTRQQIARASRGGTDVGWGLQGAPAPELQALQPEVEKRLTFLRKTIQQRLSMAQKLNVLAKVLPEGIWLEGVAYRSRLEVGGPDQAALSLRGACFLPESGDTLSAISDFAKRLKEDPEFFRGFLTSQLGQIAQAEDKAQQLVYRTFQLTCQSSERGVF